MIYYIKNEVGGAFIYPFKRFAGASTLSTVKSLCLKHLFTLEGYLKSAKKILNIQYKIPIIISRSTALFSIKGYKDYENIWINYHAIKEIYYQKEMIVFIFDTHHLLEVKLSSKSYQRIVMTIFEILKYKDSLE